MTIDEEIKHQEEISDRYARMSEYEGNDGNEGIAKDCAQCAADHAQLAEWLTELKEAKRLLKLAVEDMNDNNICYDINACNVCMEQHCIQCDTFKWRYTDEAERLINK